MHIFLSFVQSSRGYKLSNSRNSLCVSGTKSGLLNSFYIFWPDNTGAGNAGLISLKISEPLNRCRIQFLVSLARNLDDCLASWPQFGGSSGAYKPPSSILIVELHSMLPVNKNTGLPWGCQCVQFDMKAAQGIVGWWIIWKWQQGLLAAGKIGGQAIGCACSYWWGCQCGWGCGIGRQEGSPLRHLVNMKAEKSKKGEKYLEM